MGEDSRSSVWEKAAANVQVLDGTCEKKREYEQMQYMNRAPRAALASILSSWLYFGYSFKCLLDAQAGGLSGKALGVAWLSYALQLGRAVPPGTGHLLALSAMGKAKRQKLLRLTGDVCPSVDVFVTYCGEDVDVLLDTVRAAAVLDYPQDRYRVIVLDDSVSINVETAVGKLRAQSEFKRIYYSMRGIKPKTHTKAGNLNHGLKYVLGLPGGASDVVAVLDVDMIPSQHWLRASVPHLLVNSKVALASPPQRHYNIPNGEPLGQTMDILFDVVEPFKNATNSAWCCGSGFVVRRNALDVIGGVPEESLNEDILTSFFLTAAGWQIVYVHEDVQWGLVSNTIKSHLKREKRSCAGIVSTAAGLWNPQARNMTTEEKFGALSPVVAYSLSVTIDAAAMVILPLLLLSGAPLVVCSDSQLRILSILSLVRFSAAFSYNFLATKAANYHFSLSGISSISGIWAIPYQFLTLVRFAISILTGGGVPLFTPTGSNVDVHSARPIAERVKIALWDDGFIIHVIIIGSLLVGIRASFAVAFDTVNLQEVWLRLFTRAGWPEIFLIWSTFITECCIPLSYTFNPPKPVARSRLLERDPVSRLAYPTREAKDQRRIRPSQTAAVVKICYCIGACASTLYIV
ncbi:MAG: hypothetical protein Q9209_006329 [Squamulea sp. 1 TL-2023]